VKNGHILDGILTANEVIDKARKMTKELLMFKVDFKKAYYLVGWGYLDDVKAKIMFPTLWRKWIKECISMTTTFFLVNCTPTDEFPLERGLRKGDLISSSFFLATEGLHVMMKSMVESNVYIGYRIGDHDCFTCFETISGLKVNFHKILLVGVDVDDFWLNEVTSVLRCKIGKIPFVYLGMLIYGNMWRLVFWERY